MAFTKIAYTGSLLIVGLGLAVNGYSQSFLTNGLVGYYPFTGDAHDASGHTNNGTVYGATLTADRFGQANNAYSFNGSSWIDIGSVISRYDLLTLSAWVYSTDSSAGPYGHGIVSKQRMDSGGGLALTLYGGELYAQFNNWVVNLVVSNTASSTDGKWHHAVAVANVTNVSLYVDGRLSGSASFASNAVTSAVSMFIGKELSGEELRFFTGLIDDIRIYNRALSASEVQQLYAIEATPPQGFETNGLVAYYPFNGNANDASGNGNSGTAYGGTTLTADRFGSPNSAYDFDGGMSYIAIPQNPALNSLTTNFTVSAWIWQMGDGSPHGYRIIDKALAGTTNGWLVDTVNCSVGTGPNHRPRLQAAAANACNVDGTTDYSLMKWHHIVASVSGTIGNVYLDGNLDGTGNVGNIPTNALDVYIGVAHPATTVGFNGIIDDVRIYNRALSSDEVAQLYALEAPPILNVRKAVYLDSPNLKVSTNYQMQVSADLNTWTNYGAPFTATNSTWRTTNYWDVDNWNSLYFRLQVSP